MVNQITRFGVAVLRDAISKQQARVRIAGLDIGEAAGPNCDWHDNFAYEDALRRHDIESTRLAKLVAVLSSAEIINVQEQAEVVAVGTTIDLLWNEENKIFTIGGVQEELPRKNLISLESPIAKAIIGLRLGEATEIVIGGRSAELKILAIRPPSARYNALLTDYLSYLGIQVD